MFRFGATIFLGAFLLFLVQPMLGKRILPWFGGTPAVWTTCMLFFQVLLLAGYAWSHLLDRTLRARGQALAQTAVLLGALGVIAWQIVGWEAPLLTAEGFKPTDSLAPVVDILTVLLVGIGLAFFVLSSTSPLLQAWFRRDFPGRSPYRLYSLSNAGSLLALLAYPFLIEPAFELGLQSWLWTGLFGAFALLQLSLCVKMFLRKAPQPVESAVDGDLADEVPPSPGIKRYLLWMVLAACGSAMLLAATNQMCQDVAVVPFLWVLPLALYLLSFILTFESERWYKRSIFAGALVVISLLTTLVIFMEFRVAAGFRVLLYSGMLFVCCMVCHGELARLKPHPRYLTGFYMMLSVGGAAGGIFVGLIAPQIFSGYWELHLSLFGCALLLWGLQAAEPGSWMRRGKSELRRGLATAWIVVLGLALLAHTQLFQSRAKTSDRNFYGILRVTEENTSSERLHRFDLLHGLILHGMDFANPPYHGQANAYFGPSSGLGFMMNHHPHRLGACPATTCMKPATENECTPDRSACPLSGGPPGALAEVDGSLRVGVIGLGVGIIAAWGQPGDLIRFYEINPAVVDLAQGQGGYFSFLPGSQAQVEVVLGDARLSMERELLQTGGQDYDILVIDAFSSDSIPMHLLTAEAFELYLMHLKPDGVLALHVSNRHLDLYGVVLRLAHHNNLPVASVLDTTRGDFWLVSDWLLVTANEDFLSLPTVAENTLRPDRFGSRLPVSLWTDDFNSLLEVLVWGSGE